MVFKVENKVFDAMPNVCFGVVVAKGIDNTKQSPQISAMLEENATKCESELQGLKVKETSYVAPYRNAFTNLGINPNKFMCSIEALLSRISKGKGIPSINSAIYLCNTISLKYQLHIGAHDIASTNQDLQVRYTKTDDYFIPFGSTEKETAEPEEIVYASENSIRTRRWIWRQSEQGKITNTTTDIIFPIDGFSDINKEQILLAQAELASLLKELFNCEVLTDGVDVDKQSAEF